MVSVNSINNTVQNNDFSVNRSLAGTAVFSSVVHSDNTNAVSNAKFKATVGGANGGDAYTNYLITGAGTWTTGIDNSSTTDLFKITNSLDPSAGAEFVKMGNNTVKDFIGFFDYAGPTDLDQPTFGLTDSVIGGNVGFRAANSDNTNAASNCFIGTSVGGSSAGDPGFTATTGPTFFTLGIDNSNGDVLTITPTASPSIGTVLWQMTTAGQRTMPVQPAFLAYNSVTDANQTGNGAAPTVDFDTEVFDQGANFAADTFTAPVTGRYQLNTNVDVNSVSIAMTIGLIQIVTSNRTYQSSTNNPAICKTANSETGYSLSALVDMDAADTATVLVVLFNGAGNTAGVVGGATLTTFFSGYLAC